MSYLCINYVAIKLCKNTLPAQETFTCSKLTIETLEKGVTYVQI